MELQGGNPRIATPLEIHKHWHRGLGATELQGTMLTTQAMEHNKIFAAASIPDGGMLKTLHQGLSQASKATADLGKNFKQLLVQQPTQMEK